MKALLLDPERESYDYLEFDGNEESIADLLGQEEFQWDTYIPELGKRIRIYRKANSVENARLPGYVIEHTGGVVNHGKCLVVGVDSVGQFTDVPPVTITYVFVPGQGAFVSWRDKKSVEENGTPNRQKKISPLVRIVSGVIGVLGFVAIAFNASEDNGLEIDFALIASFFAGFVFLFVSLFGKYPWDRNGPHERE